MTTLEYLYLWWGRKYPLFKWGVFPLGKKEMCEFAEFYAEQIGRSEHP